MPAMNSTLMSKSLKILKLRKCFLLFCLSLLILVASSCHSSVSVHDTNTLVTTQKTEIKIPPTATYPSQEVTPETPETTTNPQPEVPVITSTSLLPSTTPSPQLLISKISSPLEDVSIQELSQILSNPFLQPSSGQDDGHHGADFAFYRWKDRVGMTGLPVYSVFDGKITAVIYDSMPYGNFVIIETVLDHLPITIIEVVTIPAVPTIMPDTRLTCPPETLAQTYDFSKKSAYVLYAHLDTIGDWLIGETIQSGQAIGVVGNTGLSSNPHLHLELRIGPSNAAFEEMSHYRADATNESMANYCLWRASETFQLIDPMALFSN